MTSKRPVLIVMRLVDMHRVHPEQVAGNCARCGGIVGIYPSGQQVMRQRPDVEIVCQVCMGPVSRTAQLAPGAIAEPFQSRRRKT